MGTTLQLQNYICGGVISTCQQANLRTVRHISSRPTIWVTLPLMVHSSSRNQSPSRDVRSLRRSRAAVAGKEEEEEEEEEGGGGRWEGRKAEEKQREERGKGEKGEEGGRKQR